MKFSCDSCNAQYMISDAKIGPNGVKVRCKKCSHVIILKRPTGEAAAAAPTSRQEKGLDEELGQAFDAAFGGIDEEDGDQAAEKAARDMASTQLDDGARAAGQGKGGQASPNGAAAEPAAEWYVAIRDAQVGPLSVPVVKQKWESGEIGPDTLVWRPGMADWGKLAGVSDLAQVLVPVARPSSAPKVERVRPAESKPALAAVQPDGVAHDVEWQPNAGSALAALVNEEIATSPLAAPAVKKSVVNVARTNGSHSLLDSMNLPDGGVDPTGAIPLSVKTEQTSESSLKRKSSVARDSAEVRLRRSNSRTIAFFSIVLVLLAGGAAAAFYVLYNKIGQQPVVQVVTAPPVKSPVGTAPVQPPPVAVVPTPQPTPVAAAPVPQPEPVRQPVAAAPTPAPVAPAPEPARAQPAPPRVAAAPPRPARVERAEPKAPPRRPERVARAEPPPEPPPPQPAPPREPAKPKGSGDLFSGSRDQDDAFTKALEQDEGPGVKPKSSGHVYVPPAPGGDLPDSVSTSQIVESVADQRGALQRCISEQKGSGGAQNGTIKMGWTIRPDGGASNVRCLTPQFANQPFSTCIAGVVKSVRFPKSRSGKSGVEFPFTF